MMAFWVYMLRCSDGSYYTGHTDNLEERIGKHKTGAMPGCYTFKRRPIELVFSQEFSTREQALSSEQQIKGWSRKKKEAMIRNDWAEVSRLARSAVSVYPQPHAAAHPDLHATAPAHPEPCATVPVRPEPFDKAQESLVEGHVEERFANCAEPPSKAQENLVEVHRTILSDGCCVPSVHPSTGSGRTEGDEV